MSGDFTLHIPSLATEDSQGQGRRSIADFTQALVRGRLLTIPWYEMDITANHAYTAMTRPWPTAATAQQGIVAPVDLALVALGYNFRGAKTNGEIRVRLERSHGGAPFDTTLWGTLIVSNNADNGLLTTSPDLDIIPAGDLWALFSFTSGFAPSGSVDIEVYAYLAPV